METLSKYFAKLTQPALGKHGFAQADLLSQWETIAGPDIARACAPSQIKRPRDGGAGTLVVKAHSGLALELQYQVPRLIERVNQYFGYQAIGTVKVLQSAHARPKPVVRPMADPGPVAARLSGFDNDALKSALSLLGAAVAARNPQTK